MTYHVAKKGKRYAIVRDEDKKVVGTSDTKKKALRSIGYRMEAHMKSENKGAMKKPIKAL